MEGIAMIESKDSFEGWAVLELMGHRRLAGYVREQEVAGVMLLRIDIPGDDGQPVMTQFYGASAIYCLTPTTEETAKATAKMGRPQPVERWEFQRAIPANAGADEDDVPY
jgi:hypothetical protein